jgi:hypothetical protein
MLISYLNPDLDCVYEGRGLDPFRRTKGRVALLSRILPSRHTPLRDFLRESRDLVNARRAAAREAARAIKNRRGDLRRDAGS